MPKYPIDTSTKPGGSSSEPTESQSQPRFGNAFICLESGSGMRYKSKSKSKTRSEIQVVSRPSADASSSSRTMIPPAETKTESNSTSNQVEVTYDQLVSLGMPADIISLTEFGRIYHAPLSTSGFTSSISITTKSTNPKLKSTKFMPKSKAEETIHAASTLTQALDFICTHLVGRQEVRKRRARISQILEEHSTRISKLKAPSNFNKDDIRALLNNPKQTAQTANSSARRTLDAVQREWEVINEDMQRLDINHRTEKKNLEGAREVLFLLNILEKREAVRMRRMGDLGRLVDDLRKEADLAMREFRNAAASSDGLTESEGEREIGNVRYRHTTETLAKLHRYHLRGQVNGLDRLDVALGRLGVDDEGMKQKILQLTRRRTRERLQRLVYVNEQKEKDVQVKINRVVAIGFLSEGYLDCRLKDPEIQQQNGYIDQLRLVIVGESSTVGPLSAKRVRIPERLAILALKPRNTSETHPIIPLLASQINPNLPRKSEKSLLGFGIASDIDRLRAEATSRRLL